MRTIGNPRWSHPVAFINGVDVDMVDVVKMLMIEYTTKDFLVFFFIQNQILRKITLKGTKTFELLSVYPEFPKGHLLE